MLIVVSSLQGGGAERVVSLLATGWAARGCDVHVLTFETPTSLDYKLHPQVTRSWPQTESRSSVSRLLWFIRTTISRFSPEVVVSFIDVANVLTLLASFGQRTPVVVSERTNPRKHSIRRHWRLLRRFTYQWASSLVVQTESVRQWATRFVSPERIAVIQNPLFDVTFTEASKRDTKGEFTIISVGRISHEKGFDLLVEAFAQVCRSHPNCRLEICGDGPERPQIERMLQSLNLTQRVTMRGFVRDVESYLIRADLFVLPSRYEGFPNALCEAMSAGLPVVSFDCESGPGEIITHRKNGLLVPKENPAALADAIEELINNPTLRAALGDRARSIRERLSLTNVLSHWDRVLPARNSVRGL